VTEEERSVFTQDFYQFQSRSPVLQSRFVLTLPAAWEVKGVVFNRDPLEPQVSGNTYTWEMRNLPWMEREDYSPEIDALVPRLAVSVFPPTDNRAGLQGLKDWPAVSAWLAPLVDPSAEVTDTIRSKSQQLTANAPSELDKIRAIAAFTQQTNYVEVALNLTRGGGYTPRKAADTLARNYGDCKDKATLMRALLKAAGIDSYLTTITANERSYVRPEWASPMQFNHAIVAVRVSDAISLPTVLKDTALGRLLIFDPTDPMTPVGDLPEGEQGSHALVIAGARGALLTMPLLPASANRIESSVEGTVDAGGRLEARIERQYFGQSSMLLRRVETSRGSEELTKRVERTYARKMAGTTVSGVTTAAHPEDNRLALHVDLAAERFAQIMQGRLFVVRAGLLSSGGDYVLNSKQRSSPVKLEADLRRDSIRIKLPPGFQLDELPQPIKVESPYGTLEAAWTVTDGEIVMTQSLEVREQVVQTAEYAKVRDFFEQVAAAGSAPVVLVKR
jgi:transglutaminase-like putative cysteine protease